MQHVIDINNNKYLPPNIFIIKIMEKEYNGFSYRYLQKTGPSRKNKLTVVYGDYINFDTVSLMKLINSSEKKMVKALKKYGHIDFE